MKESRNSEMFREFKSAIYNDNVELACDILNTHHSEFKSHQLNVALLSAVARPHVTIVKALLSFGADPNGYLDQVPLPQALWQDEEDMDLEKCLALVKRLLEAGADPERQDENTYTALMYAVSNHYNDIAKVLIEAGASMESETYDGDTAMDMAERAGNTYILEYVQNRNST
jgi:ankyrin repeat protein